MALNVKPCYLRAIYPSCRSYCDYKSIYERNEAGPQLRKAHGKLYPDWRRPWIQRDGEWSSKLSVFVEKSPSMHILNAMQKLPNLTYEDVKEWWGQMKSIQEVENQKFLPERVAALGTNLAAVHFFTYRQCAIRIKGRVEWIKGDITNLKLPDTYKDGYFVEAIDCSTFHHNGIRYEGLQNLSGLNFLKWLSLKNNKHVDVWCLDKIAGLNGNSIEFLNIEGCNLCPGAVQAIARMHALKYLKISDPGENVKLQAALSILELERPSLLINATVDIEDVVKGGP